MVFVIPPHTITGLLDLSLPKLLLGSKEVNLTAWRVLSDLIAGKTKRPQQRTLEKFANLAVARLNSTRTPSDFLEMLKGIPDGRPWEVSLASWNAGRRAVAPDYDPSVELFNVEAARMEQIAYEAARKAKEQGDWKGAVDEIRRWELCRLPSLQWVLGNLDVGSQERFVATVSPLIVTSTLYLMACWSVDWYGVEEHATRISMIPEQRGTRLVRPMTRWLEGLKARRKSRTLRTLSDYLLYPHSTDEDVETLRRVFRNWWTKGDIPPWSRVPHIVHSLCLVHGEENREQIQDELHMILAMIRLMDKLLQFSLEIRDRWLPDYDPLAPFRDAPLISEHAREAKTALLLQAKQ